MLGVQVQKGELGVPLTCCPARGPVVLTALRQQEMGSLAKKRSRAVTIDIVVGNSFIVFVKLALSSCVRKQKGGRESGKHTP